MLFLGGGGGEKRSLTQVPASNMGARKEGAREPQPRIPFFLAPGDVVADELASINFKRLVFRLVNLHNGSLQDLLHLVFSISHYFFHLKQKSINVSLSLWHLQKCNFLG